MAEEQKEKEEKQADLEQILLQGWKSLEQTAAFGRVVANPHLYLSKSLLTRILYLLTPSLTSIFNPQVVQAAVPQHARPLPGLHHPAHHGRRPGPPDTNRRLQARRSQCVYQHHHCSL